MPKKLERDESYVEDALLICDKITHYMQEAATTADFTSDEKLKDAVMLQLIYLGEACSRISDLRQELNPKIDWHRIKGMRNRLAHEYWQENAEVVYETATQAVPKLRAMFVDFKY